MRYDILCRLYPFSSYRRAGIYRSHFNAHTTHLIHCKPFEDNTYAVPCTSVQTENFVSLRYTATGSHVGAPHNGIQPTGRRAQWTACGNFVLDSFNAAAGEKPRIRKWLKDWDKMQSEFQSFVPLVADNSSVLALLARCVHYPGLDTTPSIQPS